MCWKCGNTNSFGSKVEFRAVCENCGTDLHSCKNCKFFSLGNHYDCLETVEEAVNDKERANFCEFFVFEKKSFNSNKKDLKADFDALFAGGI